DSFSVSPVFTIIAQMTINGNSEGSTHCAHSAMPSAQAETYFSGRAISAAENAVKITNSNAYFAFFAIIAALRRLFARMFSESELYAGERILRAALKM